MTRALHRAALSLYLLAGGCLDSLVSAECTDELTECAGTCVALDSDPHNCGGCGIACEGACVQGECRGGAAAGDRVALGADGGAGTEVDGAPDFRSDGGAAPDADGACGPACASGICLDGQCQDDVAGHIVVIGHDFSATHPALARLLGNAVFLAPASPARVVTFVGDAEPAAVARIRQAIDTVAGITGRSWQEVVAYSPAAVPRLLAGADVFLLPAQTLAEPATLTGLGAGWSDALTNFVAAGGIIVVLDGGGPNGGTHQVLGAAGLFHASAAIPVTGQVVQLTAPADAVLASVPLQYLAIVRSVGFADATGSPVAHAGDVPVVIHQPIY